MLPAKGPEEVAAMADPKAPSGAGDKKPAPTLTYSGPDMRGHAANLREKRQAAEGMGGKERIEKQHGEGKLTVRERLDLLFDRGTFTELGLLGHHQSSS